MPLGSGERPRFSIAESFFSLPLFGPFSSSSLTFLKR